MARSTSRVMSDTRARALAQGLRIRECECECETLWDVGLPEQLARLNTLLAKAVP